MSSQSKKKQTIPPLVLQNRLPEKGRVPFFLWNMLLLLIGCSLLTYFTLRLSYSSLNPEIWLGYWEDLFIPLMNLMILGSVCLLLFALLGRAWLAYLLTAVLALGVTLGNYYLIIIRSDPLEFQDLTCLREALAITGTQGYELELSATILLALGGSLGFTVLLALLSRWKPRWGKGRLVSLVLAAVLVAGVFALGLTSRVVELTKNYKHINTWSVTEIYVSRGVIYSFTRSAFYGDGKPWDYSAAKAEETLARFTETDIPDDAKFDVFVVMRESYADLSELDCDRSALDFSCYDTYHALRDQAVVWGNLVTNGFGGNTKDAERAFLTGCYTTRDWRRPTNSYLWYFQEQGYRIEGAHPFNGWFYNRLNVNRYLGFDAYKFREDGFDELVGAENIAEDEVLFDVVWEQYQDWIAKHDEPYFHFTVTYEGHGPYGYQSNKYLGRYVKRDAATADGYAMNNYLGCCAKRDQALTQLWTRIASSARPIVLVVYGDHKATLGKDINNYTTAAYAHYGMDLDLSTEQGFFNYYSTDYVILLNDEARFRLGLTQTEPEIGPTISPCYLMNVLFDTLDWGKGPAYLQAMGEMLETFPVYSTKGRVGVEGELRTTIPALYSEQYHLMQTLNYYWQNEFLYGELSR